jgi:hypothetical protein
MAESVAFLFRRRYLLPPTDPRFLDATLDEMLIDFWAWRYHEDPKAADEIVDDEFDVEAEVARLDAQVGEVNDWEQI